MLTIFWSILYTPYDHTVSENIKIILVLGMILKMTTKPSAVVKLMEVIGSKSWAMEGARRVR